MAFARVLAEKKKRNKDSIDCKTMDGNFFEYENYKMLTKIATPPVEKDTDYVMESESESELDPVELKNKRKRGCLESDPVEPEVKRKREGPTSLKPLSELLTEIVSKPVCFDSETEEGVNPRSNKQTNDEHCQFTDFSFTFIFIHFEPYLLVIFFVKL